MSYYEHDGDILSHISFSKKHLVIVLIIVAIHIYTNVIHSTPSHRSTIHKMLQGSLQTECSIPSYQECTVKQNLNQCRINQDSAKNLKQILHKFQANHQNSEFVGKSNVRVISTWNLWGPPWESHQVFSRLQRWREFNDNQTFSLFQFYQNYENHTITATNNSNNCQMHTNFNQSQMERNEIKSEKITIETSNENVQVPLIVSCFQEAFSFVRGPGINNCKNSSQDYSHFYERTLLVGSIVKSVLFNNKGNGKQQSVAQMNLQSKSKNDTTLNNINYYTKEWNIDNVIEITQNESSSKPNILPNKAQIYRIPAIQEKSDSIWDTPRQLFESQGKIPFIYVIGTNGISLHPNRLALVDSGLGILTTWMPIDYDFMGYKNYPTVKMTGIRKIDPEVFANKGVLWAYFENKNNNVGTIVLTTHLATKNAIKKLQLNELKHLIDDLKKRFVKLNKYFEIYLTGDFNLCVHEEILANFVKEMNFISLTNHKGTNGSKKRDIDHIFIWRNDINDTSINVINHDPIIPWHYQDDPNSKFRKKRGDLSDHAWQGVMLM